MSPEHVIVGLGGQKVHAEFKADNKPLLINQQLRVGVLTSCEWRSEYPRIRTFTTTVATLHKSSMLEWPWLASSTSEACSRAVTVLRSDKIAGK